jgi:hypothetical protein
MVSLTINQKWLKLTMSKINMVKPIVAKLQLAKLTMNKINMVKPTNE